MVLVLQRRVLVMGPRIILRGAIPIDSNIGGSGHRPLLGEFVSRFWYVLSLASLPSCRACDYGVQCVSSLLWSLA